MEKNGQFTPFTRLLKPQNIIVKTIGSRVEWLWRPSNSFLYIFVVDLTFNSIPIILILLTNKNVAIIYFVKIYEQKKKQIAHRQEDPNMNYSTVVFIFDAFYLS